MAETGIRGFWTRWREERIPFLAAAIEPWAYTESEELSWLSRLDNAQRRATRWFRWSWWRCMLERPVESAEKRGTTYFTVVLCRMRGHAGRIFYNPGGME